MKKNNEYKKVSLFSPKINLIGLTKEEERIITDWYCNGKHNNYSEKNKLLKSRIKTKAINMFEKILYQIGIFNETTQIEIINDFVNKSKYPILKNFFKFKCKNSKGENIIVRLYAGGGYDNVPTLNITNKDNYIIYEIPFIDYNFFQQFQPSIKMVDDKYTAKTKKDAREEYNTIFEQKGENFDKQEKVTIRVPKTKKEETINNQEMEQKLESTIKKL